MKNNLIKVFGLATLLTISSIALNAQTLVNPEDQSWYPSAYGSKDEIGAANLLTPEVVKQALGLVKQGKTLALAVPIDKNLPAFRHRSFNLYNIQPGEQGGKSIGPNKFTFNDELVNGWTGVGTQLNGIGHIGIDNTYYNGNKATDFVTVEGVKKLGVEKVPPFVTRGVVLDMTAHYGKSIVPGGTEFTVEDIQSVLPVLMLLFTALSSCENIKNSKYITIGMVDGWAEDVAMTHLAKAILDEQGYHVIIQKASTDMILASMNNEDTDLFMGIWLPYTHAKKLAKFPGLTYLGTNYDNGRIGLVVPDYVPVNSIEELNQHKDQFNRRIIGIEKGAGLTTGTDKAIIDYKLDYQQINSSTIAMITELQNAIQRKQWIVVTGWQPHWMFGKMKLKFLDDPKKIYGDAEQIKTYSRKSFSKDHPELARFFSKLHFDDENMSDLLMKMEQSKNKEATAKEWVKDHPELVQSWLNKN